MLQCPRLTAKANVNPPAIDPVQPKVLYAGTSGPEEGLGFRGPFKSTDSGANWSPINNGLANILDTRAPVNAPILDPNHTDTLYLGTSGYGVFKSSDAGAIWDPFNEGTTHLDVRVPTLIPGASATVYADMPGGVFKMVDDGNSMPHLAGVSMALWDLTTLGCPVWMALLFPLR